MNICTDENSDLNAESVPSADQVDHLDSRLKRYAKAVRRSREMSAHLRANDELRLWTRLKDCGSYLLFRHYFTVGVLRLVKACFCKKHLLCPLCAVRRSAKQLRRYYQLFQTITEQPWFPGVYVQLVTLTVKNGDDLAERFDHLMRGVRTLRKRLTDKKRGKSCRSEWRKVLGLVGSYEVTRSEEGWHPHVHIIVISSAPIIQEALSQEWHKITGDSFITDVSAMTDPANHLKDFCEVFKYSMKFSDLTVSDNYHAFKMLQKRRLCFSQGLFYGVPDVDTLTDAPLEDLPFIELLYRFTAESGYSLDRTHLPSEASRSRFVVDRACEGATDRERELEKEIA